jgi:hypothetical protein
MSPSTLKASKVLRRNQGGHACLPLLDKVTVDGPGAASCCVRVRKLVTQWSVLVHFAYGHSGQEFLKQAANCVKLTGP